MLRALNVLLAAALLALPPLPGDAMASATTASGTDANGDGKVVIAVVDTGINPYHVDFRDPTRTAHPSTYLPGFPADAPALNLTFGDRYAASREADDPLWRSIPTGALHWIPGTRVVGAIATGAPPSGGPLSPNPYPPRPILDDHGHGTAVASAAVGSLHGSCPECLLVVVEGAGSGLAWAAAQPWIDVISNSWGPLGNLPLGSEDKITARAAEEGKVVLFAASNGYTNTAILPDRETTLLSPTSGPGWVVTVGASTPQGDDYPWHGWPVDVVSVGANWPTASGFSVDGTQRFGGTSCATPIVAGAFGKALLEARRAVGDTGVGPRERNLVVPAPDAALPAQGPFADGVLARYELEDALFRTARDPGEPGVRSATAVPWHPGYYVWTGWGHVSADTAETAARALLGEAPLPLREDAARWMWAQDLVRAAIWGRIDDRPSALAPPAGGVERGPIIIRGDDAFTPENGVLGGSGTAQDPYVIGGWHIAVDRGHAITIQDTDRHWIVAGNLLTSSQRAGSGVIADSAGNGQVVGNSVTGFAAGVQVLDQGIEVTGNVLRSNTVGVQVRNAGPVVRENDFLQIGSFGVAVMLPWHPDESEDPVPPTLIDAAYNYWGTDLPLPHRHHVGPFQVAPWYADSTHRTVGPRGLVAAALLNPG